MSGDELGAAIARIEAIARARAPIVVAIDERSGAGKSTLAAKSCAASGAAIRPPAGFDLIIERGAN